MISIIIPVYNVSNLLSRLIESLLSQTYKNYEILLVDDGSTDDSGEICDEYASKYDCIYSFHKSNGGICSARNFGLQKAKGDYIYFCDDDDYVYPNCLSILYEGLVNNQCCCAIGGFEIYTQDERFVKGMRDGEVSIWTSQDTIKFILHHRIYKDLGGVWIKLFKRSIIEKYNIRFDQEVFAAEDFLFSIEYLCNCNSNVFFNSQVIYRHYINSHSFSTKIFSKFTNRSVTALLTWIRIKSVIYHSKCPWTTKYLSKLMLARHYDLLIGVLNRNENIDVNERNKIHRQLKAQVFQHITIFDFYIYKGREIAKKIFYMFRNK